jgi:hypothetical protein
LDSFIWRIEVQNETRSCVCEDKQFHLWIRIIIFNLLSLIPL